MIGSSPEMIVKQQGSRVYTCPIAGTRRRGVDAEEDALLRDELLRDEKERAEHVMLVDLARNDMGRISEFGTVKVTQFMEVQNYSHVMHIVSMVEGKKKGEFHPLDLVSSFLPAGTLSGAPKIRAMEIIDELESVRRGLYGGATGYIDFSGDMDFCITIRTMIKKKNRVYLQAGAGIVADSVPENEYQECCNKVMALAKTLIEDPPIGKTCVSHILAQLQQCLCNCSPGLQSRVASVFACVPSVFGVAVIVTKSPLASFWESMRLSRWTPAKREEKTGCRHWQRN